jgi:hypothetical protein
MSEGAAMIQRCRTVLFAFAILGGLVVPALALPKTVIILRHGEKENDAALCKIGIDRSLALAAQYLGQGARDSLFASGEKPAAIFAITLHTLELASPAAATWEMPVTIFSAVPLPGIDLIPQFNLRTQQAVGALMDDPRYDGKTVVMVWEHRHIADKALELKFPDQKVTLRQLLNLDRLPDVPETWPGQTYDYFWIVEFGSSGSRVPVRFRMERQQFAAPFDKVPSNEWGKRAKLPMGSKCLP